MKMQQILSIKYFILLSTEPNKCTGRTQIKQLILYVPVTQSILK